MWIMYILMSCVNYSVLRPVNDNERTVCTETHSTYVKNPPLALQEETERLPDDYKNKTGNKQRHTSQSPLHFGLHHLFSQIDTQKCAE